MDKRQAIAFAAVVTHHPGMSDPKEPDKELSAEGIIERFGPYVGDDAGVQLAFVSAVNQAFPAKVTSISARETAERAADNSPSIA